MNRISQTVPYQIDTAFSPYSAAEVDLALSELAASGFTGVEFAVAYPARVDADEMLRRVQKHKLAVTTLSTGQICSLEGYYLTAPEEELRLGAQRTVMEHIDLSARVGRPPVTIGFIRGQCFTGDHDKQAELLAETLLPCAEYAEKMGVTIQIEPICKLETGLLNRVDEMLDFIDNKLGAPKSVGMLYDVFHSYNEDGDMFAAIRRAAGRITNVHFADSNRGLPGTGEIDFPAVYRAILDTGYSGAFALENKCIPTAEYVRAHYAGSMKRIIPGM